MSEEPKSGFSYKTMRDHAFTVTGGSVTGARRLVSGKNLRWEIVVSPDSNGDVTITLPATTDCDAQGAICTGGRQAAVQPAGDNRQRAGRIGRGRKSGKGRRHGDGQGQVAVQLGVADDERGPVAGELVAHAGAEVIPVYAPSERRRHFGPSLPAVDEAQVLRDFLRGLSHFSEVCLAFRADLVDEECGGGGAGGGHRVADDEGYVGDRCFLQQAGQSPDFLLGGPVLHGTAWVAGTLVGVDSGLPEALPGGAVEPPPCCSCNLLQVFRGQAGVER